ncbi:glycosyltransferase [Bacillus clarus]|uniref:Glycosyl transferases group 1 family protein n=1 Tax=Bacillus clarus TaxID=2338372 RepID=A0A090Z026_9BACI|nr:glycosyltransferase [Bacillus clarus]KFN03982.1 glycosyl transferases group 1 family protein [Bacillus clarus]RFT64824.1 glycosyltransferase [Bacillus clarus]
MKKKLLFVMPSLSTGGGEKSLINLLSQIDYSLYDVDLFLFSKTGTFMNSIPREVNILDLPSDYKIFASSLKNSIMGFLKNGQIKLAYSRLMFTIKNRLIKNAAISEQYTWEYQSKSFDVLRKEYDVAIGYLEKSSIYFVVDKVNANKKAGWIHTNYSNSGMDRQFDNPYFEQLDNLITVSEECVKSLQENFPHLKNKVTVIYNIVAPRIIYDLSKEDIKDDSLFDRNYTNIITVARLSHEKGLDLAVKSCKLILEKGYKIKWYVLGDGDERDKLESLIEDNHLSQHFKILGVRENPYPYIRKADVYVQPSRYEGKSIAIDEAKILCKPIVVTNFETAKDQINHRINGIITEMSEEGIATEIERLITDIELRERIVNNLSTETLGTEKEINKLYGIL